MDSQAHVGPTESTEGQVLTITVSDPKKESEGMNSYVSYKVNTATNREEFSYGQFGVIRRYWTCAAERPPRATCRARSCRRCRTRPASGGLGRLR